MSAKIQQLVNTLKRPKRPPLREFFVDDFEELLEGESSLPPLTLGGLRAHKHNGVSGAQATLLLKNSSLGVREKTGLFSGDCVGAVPAALPQRPGTL